MKASTKTERSKGSALTSGLMAASMRVTGRTTRSMDQDSTSGKMVDSIMAAGRTMTWMAWAFIFILTALLTRVNTERTRKLVMAYITGLIGENTKVGGTKESSTVLASTKTQPKIRLNTASGKWVSVDPGSTSRPSIK